MRKDLKRWVVMLCLLAAVMMLTAGLQPPARAGTVQENAVMTETTSHVIQTIRNSSRQKGTNFASVNIYEKANGMAARQRSGPIGTEENSIPNLIRLSANEITSTARSGHKILLL